MLLIKLHIISTMNEMLDHHPWVKLSGMSMKIKHHFVNVERSANCVRYHWITPYANALFYFCIITWKRKINLFIHLRKYLRCVHHVKNRSFVKLPWRTSWPSAASWVRITIFPTARPLRFRACFANISPSVIFAPEMWQLTAVIAELPYPKF